LKEMQSEREKEENPQSKDAPWWRTENDLRGGKKKMKTRRNKIKGRKSRKSKFSKNTRKRINKKKA